MSLRFALPVLAAAALAGGASPAGAADASATADDAGVVYLDVRDGAKAEAIAQARVEGDQPAGMDRAARRLVRSQGALAALDVDPTTGTVRSLADLSGALTGPSDEAPVRTAKDYVRAHLAALGLTAADLDGLRLDSAVTTDDGVTHVRWVQLDGGIPAFDNGLSVDLDRGGRVLDVGGSPVHLPDANAQAPKLDAADALRVVGSAGGVTVTDGPTGTLQRTEFSDGSSAELVLFDVNGLLRLAWRVRHRASPDADYDAVVDAVSGRLLHRANFVKFAVSAKVFRHYPGATVGGDQVTKDIAPLLFTGATTLVGPFARAFSDVNDNNHDDGAGEDVDPTTADSTFLTTWAHSVPGGCGANPGPLCSWDAGAPTSWQANRAQNAIQAFWLVNRFRDHLASAPIGFTQATGGFECAHPPQCSASTDDRVIVNTDDGAATDHVTGGPDNDHTNNANMSTPPDGDSPTMQMYLFYKGTGSPYRDVNGGDTAEIVYHEYTHGLSNRLVVDNSGAGALNSPESAAMGEGWSDWYAMDFLARQDPDGLVYVPDNPATPGQVDVGAYTDAIPNQIRSQPIDCPVGASAGPCPGSGSAGSGGYTFGDFGEICGCGPEVHADGEIWVETLWDLRTRLIADLGGVEQGSDKAEQLITGAMRLSPPEPSYLDMRNAILAEATALGDAADGPLHDAVWDVFTNRGMGFFAGVTGSDDTAPAESFDPLPAADGATGTVSGTVKDALTGRPVSGADITIGGHAPGEASVFATQSGADGTYRLSSVPQGNYGKLTVDGNAGYDGKVVQGVAVSGAPATVDFALNRNWASFSGGGAIASDNDATGNGVGCGAVSLIDPSQGNGWSPYNPASAKYPAPDAANHLNGLSPTATIALPRAVDITSFGADPGATCGDGASATTKQFTIETSRDGTNFSMAFDGTGAGAFVPSDAGRMRLITPVSGTGTGVRYLRLTLISPQDTCDICSGRDFIDFSELGVYGNDVPVGTLSVPATGTAGDAVILDASAFTDAGPIARYAWDFDGDGTSDQTTTAATVSHVYTAVGSFTPQVRVTDTNDGSGTASAAIAVAAPPPIPDPVVKPVKPRVRLATPTANRASVRVTCQRRCTVTATLKAGRALAERLHLQRWTVGTVRRSVRAGAATVRVTISKPVLRKLRARHIRRVTLSLRVRARDVRGLVGTLTRSPKIPISKR
jgi:hypothetical protein